MHQIRCTQPAGNYVRLTFRPAGAKRARTVWAIQVDANTFYRAAADGGLWEKETAPGIVACELIITGGKHSTKRAGLSLPYCRLEVL